MAGEGHGRREGEGWVRGRRWDGRRGSYAAHLQSTRRRCRRGWTPKRGPPWVERGWTPLPFQCFAPADSTREISTGRTGEAGTGAFGKSRRGSKRRKATNIAESGHAWGEWAHTGDVRMLTCGSIPACWLHNEEAALTIRTCGYEHPFVSSLDQHQFI